MNPPAARNGRILVIRGGAIGDFILTLPVLAALRRRFPSCDLEILGYPHIAEIAVAAGYARSVARLESPGLAAFFAPNANLDPTLCAYFASFDLILSFLYDPDLAFTTNVRRATPAQFVRGPHRPDESSPTHASDCFLQALQRLAIFDPDPVPSLRFSPPAPRFESPTVAAHPGSGAEWKNWPEARWMQLLIQLLDASQLRLLLIGGEAEGDRLQRLAAALPDHRVSVLQSRPLTEVANQLSRCSFFLGHDSGITHLAAAVGLPGLALWGTSTLDVWRPRSPLFSCLRPPLGLASLTPAQVWQTLAPALCTIPHAGVRFPSDPSPDVQPSPRP